MDQDYSLSEVTVADIMFKYDVVVHMLITSMCKDLKLEGEDTQHIKILLDKMIEHNLKVIQ